MKTVTLTNPGEIERVAIKTMGVNVKEGDNPIGRFGTVAMPRWRMIGSIASITLRYSLSSRSLGIASFFSARITAM